MKAVGPSAGSPGIAEIEEGAVALRKAMGIGGGQFHHQIVRMLAVDQRRRAVRRLAGCEQERIAIASHERIGAKHRAEIQRVGLAEIAPRGAHQHSFEERRVAAARAALIVVDRR